MSHATSHHTSGPRSLPLGAMVLVVVLMSADSTRPDSDTGAVPVRQSQTADLTAPGGADAFDTPPAAAQHAAPQPPAPQALAAQPPATQPPRTLAAAPVTVKGDGFLSWALLDRVGGGVAGSKNIAATNTSESVIKIWLVADFLRRSTEGRRKPSRARLEQASRAIRDSDDNAAESLYQAGGGNAAVDRMISRCRLTDTRLSDGWSKTQLSARDIARLGDCVADGTAAGPEWTKWVRDEMTKVRGTTAARDQPAGGRWGIIDALPEEIRKQRVALKNGWTLRSDGQWHVNCLAVTDGWALAVLARYPARRGLPYGARLCADVTRQLLTNPA